LSAIRKNAASFTDAAEIGHLIFEIYAARAICMTSESDIEKNLPPIASKSVARS